MGAIVVVVLLGLLFFGDRLRFPHRARKSASTPIAPRVVEARPDPESMDRYFTAAVLGGVIDKVHYRARMAALAATTDLYVDGAMPTTVRLLGITHADAVRVIIVARETR